MTTLLVSSHALGMDEPRAKKPILCAVDLTPTTKSAKIDAARDLALRALDYARAFGSDLELVAAYVAPPPDHPLALTGEDEESRRQREAMAAVLAGLPDDVRGIVRAGIPREVILRRAEEIDAGLIVAGQPAGGVLRRVVMGSVMERLLNATDRPLVVLPRRRE